MPEREKFEKLHLIEVLDKVSERLEIDILCYLIGGLAMIFHGTKTATKDIDLVFDSPRTAYEFMKNLKVRGFCEVQALAEEYRKLEAFGILEGPNNCRFDIFVGSVCGGLTLTDGMRDRAKEVYSKGNLKIYAISPEDIFIFKSITNRVDDLEDMAIITRRGLNWDIIEKELKSQPNFWKWIPHYYESLEELESEYHIISPSKSRIKGVAEICLGMVAIFGHFKVNDQISTHAIVKFLDGDEDFALIVLSQMNALGLIKEEGGYWLLNSNASFTNNHLLNEEEQA